MKSTWPRRCLCSAQIVQSCCLATQQPLRVEVPENNNVTCAGLEEMLCLVGGATRSDCNRTVQCSQGTGTPRDHAFLGRRRCSHNSTSGNTQLLLIHNLAFEAANFARPWFSCRMGVLMAMRRHPSSRRTARSHERRFASYRQLCKSNAAFASQTSNAAWPLKRCSRNRMTASREDHRRTVDETGASSWLGRAPRNQRLWAKC
jgi:hypothetical protein